jgi:hypothetical protein
VIGYGEMGHTHALGFRHQIRDRGGPVQQGIIGMYVQVNELRHAAPRDGQTVVREAASGGPDAWENYTETAASL